MNNSIVYRIKANLLEIGDIVLTNGDNELKEDKIKEFKSEKKSSGIRKTLKSKYSHAMIYLGGTCAHADGKGVHFFNLSKYYLLSTDKIEVLRYRDILTYEEQVQIKDFVSRRQGNKYSKKEAVLSKFSKNLKKDENKQFCSKLIANAYEIIGKKIEDGIEYMNITPKNLEDSIYFNKVELDFDEVPLEDALKKMNPKSLLMQENAVNKLDNKLRKIYKKFDIKYTSVNEALYAQILSLQNHKNFKKIDELMTNAIKETGYDTFWTYDYEENPELFYIKEKREYLNNFDNEFKVISIYGMTSQAIDELKKEEHRLRELLYQKRKTRLGYTLICLFSEIIEKHYKIIKTNCEFLDYKISEYCLDKYLPYEILTEKNMDCTFQLNQNTLKNMIKQGETLLWEIESMIFKN